MVSASISDALPNGIDLIEYMPLDQLQRMNRFVPRGTDQDMLRRVQTYDPDTTFVGFIINVTPTLPGPEVWFELFQLSDATLPDANNVQPPAPSEFGQAL